MFIGRERELGILEDLFHRDSGCACALYGRRGTGKTALVDRFCEGRKYIRIPFMVVCGSDNVSVMVSEIGRFLGRDIPSSGSFGDALRLLSEAVGREKVVILMDEFPRLVERDPSVPSVLQHFIDHELGESQSLLIVCGSSVSAMEELVGSYGSPLYGRFTGRIRLPQLSYRECAGFHDGMDRADALKVYMTVGGYPAYHLMTDCETYGEYVAGMFLGQCAPLVVEAENVVLREVGHDAVRRSILGDISRGTTCIRGIAEKEGISATMCGRHISGLCDAGMVAPVAPMAGTDRKTKMFRTVDAVVGFYHDVVVRNNVIMSSRNGEEAYGGLESSVDAFLGRRFEDVCTEYMASEYLCRGIGRWRGRIGNRIEEIPIIAETTDGVNDTVYIGDCWYAGGPVGESVLRSLEHRASFVKGYNNRRLILFSLNGFTEDLLDEVEGRKDVVLVDLDRLYGDA